MSGITEVQETKTEEATLTPKEVVEQYLSDPSVKKNLQETATFFHEKTNGNWFGIEKIQKKTPWKEVEAISNILQMLILSDLCAVTIDEKGVHKFKITLSLKDKANSLRQEVVKLQGKIDVLNKEIERLEKS